MLLSSSPLSSSQIMWWRLPSVQGMVVSHGKTLKYERILIVNFARYVLIRAAWMTPKHALLRLLKHPFGEQLVVGWLQIFCNSFISFRFLFFVFLIIENTLQHNRSAVCDCGTYKHFVNSIYIWSASNDYFNTSVKKRSPYLVCLKQ